MEIRKAIAQGRGTLTMSLPALWARDAGIKAGSKLTVEQRGPALLIGPAGGVKKTSAVYLNASKIARAPLFSVLNGLYSRGEDELIFTDVTSEKQEVLAQAVRDLVGFQLIECTEARCVVQEVARPDAERLDVLLRRVLLLLVSTAEEGPAALASGNEKTLRGLQNRDVSVNTLVLFSMRSMNKQGGQSVQEALHSYALLVLLEQLGDAYCRLYRDSHHAIPSVAPVAQKVASLLREFYEVFYNFSFDRINALHDHKNNLRGVIEARMKGGNKEELLALSHLRHICDLIVDVAKFHLTAKVV